MDDDKTRTYIAISAGTLVSHYKIVSKIGAGGMGEVYLAEDTRLHRNVALKFLSANFSADEGLRGRFIREAEATAKLNHPRIVTIYEVDTYNGRPFFAMEHVEGQTLREFSKSGPIPPERVIELSIQILNGLQAAHEKGVIHRDIKPSNILIDTEGRPKIVDFGLAAVVGGEQLTKTDSTMGTFLYMSPEQIKRQKVGPASDLFSFGVVLYQLLSGRLPFAGEHEAAVIHSITTETPASLRSQRPDIPPDLEDIVFKLLEKDAELRYQTASGVIADLKRFTHSAGTGTVARRIAPQRRPRKYLFPSLLSVIVVAAMLVFGPRIFDSGPAQEAQAGMDRLAIMYFDNLLDPSDTGRLSEIITNLLETDLSESKHTSVMSSQRLYDIQKQLGREGQRKISRDDATIIAQKAHCKKMLLGTILQTEPNLVVTSQLVDVKSGTTLASQRAEGKPGESIFTFVDLLSDEIKKDLALPVGGPGSADRSIAEVTTASTEAYRYYLEGREFENKHMELKAEEQYRMAVELDSSFAMALCRLGWVSGGEERRTNLEAAMKLRDNVTEKERLHIVSRYQISRLEFAAATETLKKTVDRYPDEKEAWYDLGAICPEMGQIDSGIARLEHVIELDPFWEEAYNRLAYLYDRKGMYDKSIWAISENVRLAPNDPNPYDTKGELLAVQGRLDDAKQAFNTALRLYPDFPHSIARMGEMLALERKYDSALTYFQKQIASDAVDQRASGRTNKCTILALQGRLRQAAEQFREAENHDVQNGLDGVQQRVWQVFMLSELTTDTMLTAARWDSVFARVEQLYPGRIPATEYSWAILNLVGVGAHSKAEQILKNWETRPGFFFDKRHSLARAALEFARGNYKTASGLIDSSLSFTSMRKGWMYFLCGYWQGRTHYAAGQYDQAIAIWSELTGMHSAGRFAFPLESVKLHYYLGRAYESSGQARLAVARYEEFLQYWNEADPDVRLVVDARARLAKLRQTI